MIFAQTPQFSRRDWLKSAAIAGGYMWSGLDLVSPLAAPFLQNGDAFLGGEFLGILPFSKEGKIPLDTPIGEGLDGRLYTDLSKLSADAPDASQPTLLPTEHFYIRTRASSLLHPGNLDLISLFSQNDPKPQHLSVELLRNQARSMGTHLMECAGNSREACFGLISVADWSGVPLAEVLDRVSPTHARASVLISGFDRYDSPSLTSQPGASWIFSRGQIQSSGAFFATEMNGRALRKDHGAPVRLVVPGWYGCTCIKWVNEIRLVDEAVEPTSQMQEFAVRTHQQGSLKLARDYQAATIDLAATPVRIEKRRVAAKIKYRVVGILWGGREPARRLEIRFNPQENYVPVDSFNQTTNDPWTFWSHTWTPAAPGSYLIRLRVADPKVPTRRLDMGFYVRETQVTET